MSDGYYGVFVDDENKKALAVYLGKGVNPAMGEEDLREIRVWLDMIDDAVYKVNSEKRLIDLSIDDFGELVLIHKLLERIKFLNGIEHHEGLRDVLKTYFAITSLKEEGMKFRLVIEGKLCGEVRRLKGEDYKVVIWGEDEGRCFKDRNG